MSASLLLQFAPTPSRVNAILRRLRGLAGGPVETTGHARIFFDTPRGSLRTRGVIVYLERLGGQWHQCLTRFDRDEALSPKRTWQAPFDGVLDVELSGETDLVGQKRLRKLKPRFEVRVRRSRCGFSTAAGDGGICVFERGWILTGKKKAAFAELSLYHPVMSLEELAGIAESWCAAAPLMPATRRTDARAHDLLGNHPPAATRAFTPDLSHDATALDAFRHIAWACLQQLLDNRDGALTPTADPEYVHQLRIAVRRLRAAMQIFREIIPASFSEQALPVLRELMATLGRTRDLDVLIHDIVMPVEQALPDETRLHALGARLLATRERARLDTVRLLQSPRHLRQLLHLAVAIKALAAGSGEGVADVLLCDLVDRRLGKRLKAVRRTARAAKDQDPASLHELRIAIKRLRYGLEFFSSLLPGKTSRRLLARLAKLQEDLGQLNDLANAGALLMDSAGEDAALREAVTLIGGWHGARYAALLKVIPRHLSAVRRVRLPRIGAPVAPSRSD